MYQYEISYSFTKSKHESVPEEERHGQSVQQVTTDIPIESTDHTRELARQIFQTIPYCEKVMINLIYVLDENGNKIELDG